MRDGTTRDAGCVSRAGASGPVQGSRLTIHLGRAGDPRQVRQNPDDRAMTETPGRMIISCCEGSVRRRRSRSPRHGRSRSSDYNAKTAKIAKMPATLNIADPVLRKLCDLCALCGLRVKNAAAPPSRTQNDSPDPFVQPRPPRGSQTPHPISPATHRNSPICDKSFHVAKMNNPASNASPARKLYSCARRGKGRPNAASNK
jgi:hypothetical protein